MSRRIRSVFFLLVLLSSFVSVTHAQTSISRRATQPEGFAAAVWEWFSSLVRLGGPVAEGTGQAVWEKDGSSFDPNGSKRGGALPLKRIPGADSLLKPNRNK